MSEYHIGCGIAGIYAGRLNKAKTMWLQKNDVTKDALASVRDYLRSHIEDGKNSFGYEWNIKDGKVVSLVVSVREDKNYESCPNNDV